MFLRSLHFNVDGWLRSSVFIPVFLTLPVGYIFGCLPYLFTDLSSPQVVLSDVKNLLFNLQLSSTRDGHFSFTFIEKASSAPNVDQSIDSARDEFLDTCIM